MRFQSTSRTGNRARKVLMLTQGRPSWRGLLSFTVKLTGKRPGPLSVRGGNGKFITNVSVAGCNGCTRNRSCTLRLSQT